MPAVLNTNHAWYKTINRSIKLLAGVTAGGAAPASAPPVTADFIVGDAGAPVGGDTAYSNPAMAGKNLIIFKPGGGLLASSDFTPNPAGGFSLITPFVCGDRWIILGF